jgi:hypothetical protein
MGNALGCFLIHPGGSLNGVMVFGQAKLKRYSA